MFPTLLLSLISLSSVSAAADRPDAPVHLGGSLDMGFALVGGVRPGANVTASFAYNDLPAWNLGITASIGFGGLANNTCAAQTSTCQATTVTIPVTLGLRKPIGRGDLGYVDLGIGLYNFATVVRFSQVTNARFDPWPGLYLGAGLLMPLAPRFHTTLSASIHVPAFREVILGLSLGILVDVARKRPKEKDK